MDPIPVANPGKASLATFFLVMSAVFILVAVVIGDFAAFLVALFIFLWALLFCADEFAKLCAQRSEKDRPKIIRDSADEDPEDREPVTEWIASFEREGVTRTPFLRFVRICVPCKDSEERLWSLPSEFLFRVDRFSDPEALVVFGEEAAAQRYCNSHFGPCILCAHEVEDHLSSGRLRTRPGRRCVVSELWFSHVEDTVRALADRSRHAVRCRDALCRDSIEDFCASNRIETPLLRLVEQGKETPV